MSPVPVRPPPGAAGAPSSPCWPPSSLVLAPAAPPAPAPRPSAPPPRSRPPTPTATPPRPRAPRRRRPSPSTLTDDEGTAVTLAAEPQKIVSLTPAVTETLFARRRRRPGRRHRRLERLSRRGEGLPDVVTFGTVDVEKIVEPRPRPRHRRRRRLHVGRRDRAAPRRSGSRSSSSRPRRSMASTRTSSSSATRRRRGRRGRPRSRPTMRADMDAIADGCRGRVAKATPAARLLRRRLHRRDRPDLRPGRGLVPRRDGRRSLGGRRRSRGDTVTYEIPLETLIERDPRGRSSSASTPFYTPTPETIAKRPGWKVLTAVKSGDVRSVDRHRDHPARAAPRDRACATWRSRCTRTSPLPPAR